MKTAIISCAFLFFFDYVFAQNLAIEKTESVDEISFRVTKEVNVSYYVVEGADDSLHFEILGRLNAKGYSIIPVNYDFINYGKECRQYRVKQIDMSGSCIGEMKNVPIVSNPPKVRRHLIY